MGTLVGTKVNGAPNWADCATTDLDGAEKFYAAVFGWTPMRIPGSDGSVYSLQMLGDEQVAGIYELSQELRGMGVPPHWGTYIEVEDVDAVLARVTAEGGTVVDGPVDEPGVGRMAAIQDTAGAFLRLWHSAPEHGAVPSNVAGHMNWNELAVRDPQSAARFYERVLGVGVEKVMSGPQPYTMLMAGGRPVAGVFHVTPEMGDFPASWAVYFASDDVDATQAAAIAAGGNALKEAFDIPGGSRMAVLQDPLGAVFNVMHMVMPG